MNSSERIIEKVIEKGLLGCNEELENEDKWLKSIYYVNINLGELKCPPSHQTKFIETMATLVIEENYNSYHFGPSSDGPSGDIGGTNDDVTADEEDRFILI